MWGSEPGPFGDEAGPAGERGDSADSKPVTGVKTRPLLPRFLPEGRDVARVAWVPRPLGGLADASRAEGPSERARAGCGSLGSIGGVRAARRGDSGSFEATTGVAGEA